MHGGYQAFVHPCSTIFHQKKKARIVVFHALVKTTKVFLREVSRIEEAWLADLPALGTAAAEEAEADSQQIPPQKRLKESE